VRGYPTEGAPPVDYVAHPLPHPNTLSAQIPRPWRIGLTGKEEAPFAYHKGALLYDARTGQTMLYANKTDGCMEAIAELQHAVAGHRFASGGKEVPVVTLSSAPFPTGYGMKIRPAFKLTGEWSAPPSAPPPVAPPPVAPQITSQAVTPTPDPDDDADEGEASEGLTSKPRHAAW
jgi:hypothetical protein